MPYLASLPPLACPSCNKHFMLKITSFPSTSVNTRTVMISLKRRFLFTFLLLALSGRSSREFLSFVRSGRMASLMTVYLSPDRSCSRSKPSSILTTRSLASAPLCRSLCQQTDGCVAFSFRTKQRDQGLAESKCYLFSQCQTIEDVPAGTRAVTGLLPKAKRRQGATTGDQSPRAARLVEETRMTDQDVTARLMEETRMKDQPMAPYVSRCDQMLQRSCKFTAESVIRLISRQSVNECEAACRAESKCSSFTFHPQGGGGITTSSPCVLLRDCRETVWCRGCVSLIVSGCQPQTNTARADLAQLESERVGREEAGGGAVLMAGGYSMDYVRHVEMYSPGGGCYREVRDMPEPRSRAVAGVVGPGLMMVCGGRSEKEKYSRSCSHLDLRSGQWEAGQRMRRGREDAAAVVLEGEMLVVTGGWDGYQLLDSVEVYNSEYSGWQEATGWRLTSARYQHCATRLGNTIILSGGYPSLRLVQSLSLDRGDWRGWTSLQPLRGGRVAHSCTVASLAGVPHLIVSGGQNGGEFLSSVEALPLGGEDGGDWRPLSSLPIPRRNHIMMTVAGSLVVAGGDTASYSPQRGFTYHLLPQIETLDLEHQDRGWSTTARLLSPRTVMTAAVIEEKYCSGWEY